MKFDTLLKNQKKVIKLFQNSFKKNRLVHTYLFEGAKGTSKLDAAYYFAAMILCKAKDKPCLECDDCKKVIREVHPSIFLITPDNGIIKKEQVDQLEREFSLTAIDEGKRVYIIQDIDKANASAANSLLKFLEELEGDNYGILITENINAVIPTIRSRSQIVFFDQLPAIAVAEELIAKGVDEETSHILSTISNSVDDCLALINEGMVLDLIELAKNLAISYVRKDKPPLLVLYEEGDFLLKETDKKYHNLFLDLLIMITNDKLYYNLNQINKIIFKDLMALLGLYLDVDYENILKEAEILLEFKNRLKYNINIELFYAQLLIEIVR